MRADYLSKRNETRSSLDNRMLKWIRAIGYQPYLLPSIKSIDLNIILRGVNIQGFIISGGNYIKKNSPRYEIERKLLNYSIKKKIPVLGICRGMQMMSDFEGGKLKPIHNHVRVIHNIICKFKSDKYPKKVNSFHNFTIKKLSPNFNIICTCTKGSIEAIKHKKYNWMGWMWHPERYKLFNSKLIKISKIFFKNK